MNRMRICGISGAVFALAVAIVATAIIQAGRQTMCAESKTASHGAKSQGKNHLKDASSPYLLQHADNPVDWYEWSDEAFEKAREEDKPIFLSIGYSTCHWCHVMEHESFEDEEVAKLMNDTFVCIKVDREERPDIDGVYMTVCQMMTGSGGWPLTIIMTPDKKPFFAVTYFPKENRFGRPGMLQLVPAIEDAWKNKREEIESSTEQVLGALSQATGGQAGEDLDKRDLQAAYEQLARRFDSRNGGFSSAPKFPTPHNLSFLLRYWKRSGDAKALEMVEKTLREMRLGGVYDQVGFGFHRYSTDADWLVPHFEKMLYDQAMLAIAYTEAFQATGKAEYERTTREIFTYLLRDMTSPKGGFYSAEDADSEGEEGKFYLWTDAEIRKILEKDEADLIAEVFNISGAGNFRDEATGEKTGANIPHLRQSLAEIAERKKMDETELRAEIESARKKLFEEREKRIHPSKDDKILTDWNGLMIAALAKGARVFDAPEFSEAAVRAAEFLIDEMRNKDGRLLHRYRDDNAGIPGYLDDYAFVTWGLLELYETTFDSRYLRIAVDLQNTTLEHFWDKDGGGFYFTPDDSEGLIVRQKEIYDGAIPSGNSVAMLNLLRLARITGNTDYEARAAEIGKAFSKQVKPAASAHTQLMSALDFAVGPSFEVVIAGAPGAADTREMLAELRSRFLPNKVTLLRPAGDKAAEIEKIAEFTSPMKPTDGRATAFVCENQKCNLPTTSVDKMLDLLGVGTKLE